MTKSRELPLAEGFAILEDAFRHDPSVVKNVKGLIEGPAGQAFAKILEDRKAMFYLKARMGATETLDGIPMDRDAWLGAVTGLEHAGTIWRAITAKVVQLSEAK